MFSSIWKWGRTKAVRLPVTNSMFWRVNYLLLFLVLLASYSNAGQEYEYRFSQGHLQTHNLSSSFSSAITNVNAPIVDWTNSLVLRNGIGFLENEYWEYSSNLLLDNRKASIYLWAYIRNTISKVLLLSNNFKVRIKNIRFL